ncbi:Signal transduction histidine kinase [Glycomyces sambucus]|uniref:histidine kinase n=1 Tax=Glycomyces sambucus TaxID=380244 RepID=A0A1G9M816_9ACTN|nr:sensor histidine kinase [Glycomyces sambucus]SDL70274.1 Signal transduction histidine kinase [Glycomyces sambucus]
MDISVPQALPWRRAPRVIVAGLWDGRTWLALVHLVTGSVVGTLGGIVIGVLFATGAAGLVTLVIPAAALAAILFTSAALTAVQRSRHSAFLGIRWPADQSPPVEFTWKSMLGVLAAVKTWRQFSYHVIAGVYGGFAAMIALVAWTIAPAMMAAPLFGLQSGLEIRHWALLLGGLVLLLAAPWITRGLSELDGLIARQLLVGTTRAQQLELRVTDLTVSRDSTVDAADAERRRIERDLHDGAQQRLTSLAMNLGIARATLTDLPDDAKRALADAHEESKQVLTDLRDLVRGLHPAVLEDRGLDAALSAVAARSPIPVRLKVDMKRRVARDIEAVAYFVISEALTNTARHSGAAHAAVEVVLAEDVERRDLLCLRIVDDGRGGADPESGTGLRGLADRVRSVDGTFTLTSPLGGPTTIEAELPCAS